MTFLVEFRIKPFLKNSHLIQRFIIIRLILCRYSLLIVYTNDKRRKNEQRTKEDYSFDKGKATEERVKMKLKIKN
jgi:hypothetical protein